MSAAAVNPWRAWADLQSSREKIVISERGTGAFLGTVDAWAGYAYWPVRDRTGQLVAHVRRELGGLYHPKADEAVSIQWAGRVLHDRAVSA
jgi:hypothetical protein